MGEVHECFTITETVIHEDLEFTPRGKIREDIEAGTLVLDGKLSTNADGGVKCFGQVPLALAMVPRGYGQTYPSPEFAKGGHIDRYYQRLSGQSQRKPVGICIEPICGTNYKQSRQM